MSEHEFWNELGNLYYLCGAYEPAIHAYARSIELNRAFGKPYSNMALAFVQTGKYPQAIDLYHRSIELLEDAEEKAITWNRLGILYRQVRDYNAALIAFEQADKLDSSRGETCEQGGCDVKLPLFVSMPPVDLQAILAGREQAGIEEDGLVQSLNGELEVAETHLDLQWFEDGFVAPDPAAFPVEDHPAQESDPLQQARLGPEDGWRPLVLEEAISGNETLQMETDPIHHETTESITPAAWQSQVDETDPIENGSAAVDFMSIVEDLRQADEQEAGFESPAANGTVIADEMEAETSESTAVDEERPEISENEDGVEDRPEQVNEFGSNEETGLHTGQITESETVEYAQVEYPLVELSAAELDSIQIDIARFKRILQINPRNAFAWDALGGLYKTLGKFKDAITSYQQAIALDSTRPSFFYQLGLMYSAGRRDQEAMDAFQRVLAMDPYHTLANASLGSLYRKMGLNDLAQKHIDIALKNVYEEENEYNQACLEAICGNTDRALELLQVAIEDNPSYVNWAQHDPDLDALRHDQRYHILIHQHAPAG